MWASKKRLHNFLRFGKYTCARLEVIMRLLLFILVFATACNRDESKSKSTGTEFEVVVTDPIVPAPPKEPVNPDTPSVVLTEKEKMTAEFMKLINQHRVSLGLRALVHTEELQVIAEDHSRDMASGRVAFGHAGFSERCADGKSALGGGNLCAENVAKGQKTVQAAFNAWMNSTGHRGNIEKPRVTHTGFGFEKSVSGTWYWTQIFIEKT